MSQEHVEKFSPSNRQEWRKWLKKNHQSKDAVWLVYHKKKTAIASISWSDAVDEALCFGWIDSKGVKIDDETFKHFFCKRKPKGTWSKINKEKIKSLIDNKLMMPAGLAVIEAAKQNGSWNILDEVEELIVPKDLSVAFRKNAGSKAFFMSLSKSSRKMLLQWIVLAKRPETRQKRITEIAESAAQKLKPRQFR